MRMDTATASTRNGFLPTNERNAELLSEMQLKTENIWKTTKAVKVRVWAWTSVAPEWRSRQKRKNARAPIMTPLSATMESSSRLRMRSEGLRGLRFMSWEDPGERPSATAG